MRKLFALLMVFCCLTTASGAGKDLTAAEFLAQARRPSAQQNYAKLYGKVNHLRKGAEIREATIYFGVLLTGNSRLSQVIVDNSEGYRIGQNYTSDNGGTTVTPLKDGGYPDSILAEFGIKPEDLSMYFLYWELEKELPKITFRTATCRFFILKNPQNKEAAKVAVAEDYLFPLKVEFYKDINDLTLPERSMEVEKFKQTDNGFWVPTQLKLQGPGWRTKVEFTEVDASELNPANPPSGIFKTIP